MNIPFYKQINDYSCGPASLQMVLKYFGNYIPQDVLAMQLKTQKDDGTDHSDLIRVALENGLYCYVNRNSTLHEIIYFLSRDLPVIINFMEPSGNDAHYAVVIGFNKNNLILNDPWNGRQFQIDSDWFVEHWYDTENRAKQWIMVLSLEDFHLGKQFIP